MAGGNNKKKSLRSSKNKKMGRDATKRRTTQDNKIRRLNRHVTKHPDDTSGKAALKRWKENPPNKK